MQDRLSRLGIAMACMLVAGLLALGAVFLLGVALYQGLLPEFSPAVAALITAGAALLLALIVVLIARAVSGRSRQSVVAGKSRLRPPAGLGIAGSLGQDLGEQATALVGAHARKAIMVSLIAGFVVGVSPRIRRTLWQFLQ